MLDHRRNLHFNHERSSNGARGRAELSGQSPSFGGGNSRFSMKAHSSKLIGEQGLNVRRQTFALKNAAALFVISCAAGRWRKRLMKPWVQPLARTNASPERSAFSRE